MADLANLKVLRVSESEMTSFVAIFLAGLSIGFWEHQNGLKNIYSKMTYDIFQPKMNKDAQLKRRKRWKKALKAVILIEN